MLIQGQVGQPTTVSLQPGTNPTFRQGQLGDIIVSEVQPRYYENVYRQNTFYAANQSAQTWSAGLAVSYTGLILYNFAGNVKNIIPIKIQFALSAAPAAATTLSIITGYASTGITTSTALGAGAYGSTLIGTGAPPTGKPCSSATLVGTPAYTMPIQGAAAAAAYVPAGPAILDLEGSIIIPPGGYIALGASAAVSGWGGIFWVEVPV